MKKNITREDLNLQSILETVADTIPAAKKASAVDKALLKEQLLPTLLVFLDPILEQVNVKIGTDGTEPALNVPDTLEGLL